MFQKNVLNVLCFGDSLTAGSPEYDPAYGGNRQFQYAYWMVEAAKMEGYEGLQFQNHGIPGDLASLMEKRLERTLDMSNYDVSIVLAGTNDLGIGSSVQTTFNSLKALWNISITTGVQVISCTIPPIGFLYTPLQNAQKNLNALIQEYSDENRSIICVNIYDRLSTPEGLLARLFDSGDGLHLNIDGYKKTGETIWKYGIKRILLGGLDSLG